MNRSLINKLTALTIVGSFFIGTGINAFAAPIVTVDNQVHVAMQTTHKNSDKEYLEDEDIYVDPEDLEMEIEEEPIEAEHEEDHHPHPEHDHEHEEELTQREFEDHVLKLINIERAKINIEPLKMDESVRHVARIKSKDMCEKEYFGHTSPTYGSPAKMLKSYGIDYTTVSENIATGHATPEGVVLDWMHNEGHRDNILNPNFKTIGIGFEEHGHFWTQFFVG